MHFFIQGDFFAVFVFKSSEYEVSLKENDFKNLPKSILTSLYKTKKYDIQTSVNDEIFQSIIGYFVEGKLPNIEDQLYWDYFRRNQELLIPCINDLLQLKYDSPNHRLNNIDFLKNKKMFDKSFLEKEIAEQLDEYILEYGDQLLNSEIHILQNIFNHEDRKFTQHNHTYDLICLHFKQTGDLNIFTLLPCLDGIFLSLKNQQDSIFNENQRYGFMPKFNLADILYQNNKYKEILQVFFGNQNNDTPLYLHEINKKILQICENDRFSIEKVQQLKNEYNQIILKSNQYEKNSDNFFISEIKENEPGILYNLKEEEKKKSAKPLFIASQSSCDVYNLIDPNTTDKFPFIK